MGKWRERVVVESNKERQRLGELNPRGLASTNIVPFQGLQHDPALTGSTFGRGLIYSTKYTYTCIVLKASVLVQVIGTQVFLPISELYLCRLT